MEGGGVGGLGVAAWLISASMSLRSHAQPISFVLGTELALKLFGRVAPDGCSWSISDGDVVLTLEKAEEGETWPTLSRD